LLPSLTGVGTQQASTVYVEYYNNQRTPTFEEFEVSRRGRVRNQMQLIRLNDHVGVRYDIQSPDDDFEIYDVVSDPKEKNNLALVDAGKNLQREMKEKVLQLRRPDTSAVRPYDSAFIPPVMKEHVEPGIAWATYRGDFPWIPMTDQLETSATGANAGIDPALLKSDDILLQCTGYIRVTESGDYTLALTANGTALIRIHDALVIDADFGYEPGTSRAAAVHLAAGLHPFTFLYKRNGREPADFTLMWNGPGETLGAIPVSMFYH
jgi:hypothetical protein